MITREELLAIVNTPYSELTTYEKAGRGRTLSMGLPYYGRLRKAYPVHYQMFDKIKTFNECAFKNSVEGFIDFILAIGEVPEHITKPILMRHDESKSFDVGNIYWQDSGILKRLPITSTTKLSPMRKKEILDDIIKCSKDDKIYLTKSFLTKIGYSGMDALLRGLKMLGKEVYADSEGRYIVKE